jgi:RNA polymerase sigma-70 factor, ECF subfamily
MAPFEETRGREGSPFGPLGRPGDAEAFDEAVKLGPAAVALPGPEDVRAASAATMGEIEGLVARAQAGETDALDALFRRYYGLLVDVARRRLGARLRQKEDADDLAQTTFREATRDFSRYRYQGDGSLLRWLIQILHNKIRDRAEFYSASKRDISRERAIEPGDAENAPARVEPASADLSVTRQVSREEEFAILRQALEHLSPEHRTAITLVFFQGLSLREAGERMEGRTEDAVRMLLRRAENRLGELVRKKLDAAE